MKPSPLDRRYPNVSRQRSPRRGVADSLQLGNLESAAFHRHRRPDRAAKRQTLTELRALQRLTAAAVMRPLTAASKMNPRWLNGTSTANVVACFIKPNNRLTAFERLELYNRQYWFRILDCFYEDYPGLRAVLGERAFSRLAREYLAAHPSASFTLRNLGRCLVGFLETHPKLAGPRFQLALDMARLEWAHIEAFDNAAEPPVTAEGLRDANLQTLRLCLQPYLTLLRLNYELDDFLIAVRRHQGLRHEASNARQNRRRPTPKQLRRFPLSKAFHLAVHRSRDSVFYKRLRPGQFALLSALQRGLPLEHALTQARESVGARCFQPRQVRQWFQDWASLGWFCRGANPGPDDGTVATRSKSSGNKPLISMPAHSTQLPVNQTSNT